MNHKILFKIIYFMSLGLMFGKTIALAQDGRTVTDSTDEFLLGDPGWEDVATTPPSIDFKLISLTATDGGFTHWCNVVLGPDDRYYFGIGDHQEQGTVLLVAYNPISKTDETCINSQNIFGLKEGKWHGRPDINPSNGDMYLLGFYNGDLIRFNIYSRQVSLLGKPVSEEGFPEHTWDWERERLYAVGHSGNLLVYDTKNNSVIFHGNPPDGSMWNDRARLLDRDTGCLYGSNEMYHILKYDPVKNLIISLNANLEDGSMRAWTNIRESDGSFWIFNAQGMVFKFYPEQDKIEYKGENLDDGSYVTFIERSPGGHYLYYSAARPPNEGKIIQYDTQTGRKKIIAFLQNYYLDKYDYDLNGSYGGALSKDGKSLFLVCNGQWGNIERPAMFNICIPASERTDETNLINSSKKMPLSLKLLQNYPNPFNSATSIQFSLPEAGQVSLGVFDLIGREIKTLFKDNRQSGYHTIIWDGKNTSGQDVASGIYIYRIEVKSESGQVFLASKRMIFMP
jgi:hypothetical protein